MRAVLLAPLALLVAASWAVLSRAVVADQSEETSRFDRVQYLGGMVGFRGTSPRWDNTLTVSPKLIAMKRKDSTLLFEVSLSEIKRVQYLQYGSVNIWGSPLSLLVPKAARTGDHFIGIEYFLADCQLGVLLLRAHKSNYKDVFTALTLAHKAVEVARAPETPRPCMQKPGDGQAGSSSQ